MCVLLYQCALRRDSFAFTCASILYFAGDAPSETHRQSNLACVQ